MTNLNELLKRCHSFQNMKNATYTFGRDFIIHQYQLLNIM